MHIEKWISFFIKLAFNQIVYDLIINFFACLFKKKKKIDKFCCHNNTQFIFSLLCLFFAFVWFDTLKKCNSNKKLCLFESNSINFFFPVFLLKHMMREKSSRMKQKEQKIFFATFSVSIEEIFKKMTKM